MSPSSWTRTFIQQKLKGFQGPSQLCLYTFRFPPTPTEQSQPQATQLRLLVFLQALPLNNLSLAGSQFLPTTIYPRREKHLAKAWNDFFWVQHCTEVAFALLTQQHQARIPALRRHFFRDFSSPYCLVGVQYWEIEPIQRLSKQGSSL